MIVGILFVVIGFLFTSMGSTMFKREFNDRLDERKSRRSRRDDDED